MADIPEVLSPREYIDMLNDIVNCYNIGIFASLLEGTHSEEMGLPHKIGMIFNINPIYALPIDIGILMGTPDGSERVVSLVDPNDKASTCIRIAKVNDKGVNVSVGLEDPNVVKLPLDNGTQMIASAKFDGDFARIDFYSEGDILPLTFVDVGLDQ